MNRIRAGYRTYKLRTVEKLMERMAIKNRTGKVIFCCGLAMMGIGLLALGAASGVFYEKTNAEPTVENTTQSDVDRLLGQIREKTKGTEIERMLLHADTAARGKTMSLATGQVNANVQGLFVLDHTSGRLSCVVLSPRSGGDGVAVFAANVNETLGQAKAGQTDYLMATGAINANVGGRAGQNRPSGCVCYVANSSTGQVAAYTFQFNNTMLENGQAQNGPLTVVWQGASREPAAVRD